MAWAGSINCKHAFKLNRNAIVNVRVALHNYHIFTIPIVSLKPILPNFVFFIFQLSILDLVFVTFEKKMLKQ